MNLSILSKHRGPIYGFAIILVMLFHGTIHRGVDYTFGIEQLQFLQAFIDLGAIGVEIFIFMSGISLYFSFSRNNDILAFYKRRFWRVVPAVWILYGWYWVLHYLIQQFALAEFIPRFMLVELFMMTRDLTLWYISLILVLYLAYPLIYTFLFGGRRSGLRCLVLVLVVGTLVVALRYQNPDAYVPLEIALTRIPIFIIGCWLGKHVHDGTRIPKASIVLVFALVVLYFVGEQSGIFYSVWRRYFCTMGGIAICFAIALICEAFNVLGQKHRGDTESKHGPIYRFLSWSGGLSLELYVSHGMLIVVASEFFGDTWFAGDSIVSFAVLLAIAYVLSVVVSKLVKMLQKKVAARGARA